MFKKQLRTPIVLQMEALECGAAALSMVLGYFGRYVPLEQLRLDCGISRDGSKASNVLRAARLYGLVAKGYKREIDELKQAQLPCILFWEFNHFVVLDAIEGGKYYINDPASGHRVVLASDFEKSFTGVVLEFETGPDFVAGGEKPSLFRTALQQFRQVPALILYVSIAGLILAFVQLTFPAYVRIFVDDVLVNQLEGYLSPLVVLMVVAAAMLGMVLILKDYFVARFGTKLKLSSSQFFWHVLRLPIEFFSQRYVGDISARAQSNTEMAQVISTQFADLVVNLLLILLFSVVMIRYDAVLTVVCFVVFVLNILAIQWISKYKTEISDREQSERNRILSAVISGLYTIEALKANGSEADFFARVSGLRAKMANARDRFITESAFVDALPSFFLMFALMIILTVGSLRVFDGNLTLGMLIAFELLAVGLLAPMARIAMGAQVFEQLKFQRARIDDVMHYRLDPEWQKRPLDEQGDNAIKQLSGRISIRDLSFSYDRYSKPVIENFNLEVSAGSRVAIVGSTGSGKSTIAKLICGLYEPLSGEIRFDDALRSEIPREVIASQLGYVEQDIYLFSGTILNNLTLWDESVPRDDVVQAAKDAQIHNEVLNVLNGYDGLIEEGGRNLSGGEIQRFEIARALVRNPSILVLDECTSALDPLTEKSIDDNLRRRGCTCIIVAHRLSTIRDCDQIVVIEAGRVVQQGTHDDLIKQEGSYKALVERSV